MNQTAQIIQFPQMAQPKFQPPTIEECQLHAAKIGLPDKEAQKFFLFYDGKDWFVGKNKMKRWHSSMALWKLNYGGSEKKQFIKAKIPTRNEAYEYAKQRGDKAGFVINWYDSWAGRDFMRNGMPIDWQIEFSKSFANQRT